MVNSRLKKAIQRASLEWMEMMLFVAHGNLVASWARVCVCTEKISPFQLSSGEPSLYPIVMSH